MFEGNNAPDEGFGSDPSNLYAVLDLKPDATAAEIQEAYVRIKTTYAKDSVALYSLVDSGDRELILKRVERAYATLSNVEKRRTYDQGLEQATPDSHDSHESHAAPSQADPSLGQNVISIDRFPPMESDENAERALISPVTDFSFQSPVGSLGKASSPFDAAHFVRSGNSSPAPTPAQVQTPPPRKIPTPITPAKVYTPVMPPLPAHPEDVEVEIQAETEWSGAFLRKVREARGISVEELTQATRITRSYIVLIEEETLSKLPAPVYIRGFVNQIARVLRLSNQDVASAYMRRCQRLYPEKFG
jgi:hypothetical protein